MRHIVMIGTGFDTRGGIAAVVRVYAEQGLFERERVRYIATHCDGSKWRKLGLALMAWFTYMGYLLTWRVALLHVHSSSGPSFWRKCAFMVPSFALGVPVVLHWHGGRFVPFFRGRSQPVQRLIAWVFRRCDRVIVLSMQWNTTLRECISGFKHVIITNPVLIPPFAAPLDGDPPAALFLGLVHEAKGVFELLQAWPAVLARLPQARLRIAGAGDLAAGQAQARALGIERNVDFLGWIDLETRSAELARAWLMTLPSHYEGVPMAVLEAMAAGVPVVATRVGGIPLAVRDDADGLLVEAHDVQALSEALAGLLQDSQRRRAMGVSARQRARDEFGAEAIVQQVSALWRGLSLPRAGNTEPK